MTDEELVARYLAVGDPADFREVVERNQAAVLRIVSSVLGPFRHTDAEEAAQEVFLRLHGKLSQYLGQAKFSTWLYRLAYRVAINHSRRSRYRLPHDSIDALRMLAAADDPQSDALTAERAGLVATAVEELPNLYRTVIYLFYWHDRPVAEIAELIGAPANTVKSYLARARTRIESSLAKRGITE